MKPVGKTADFLAGHLEADEERAAGLNKVKAAIEAEHLTMVRRVFKSLPDPIPAKFDTIRQAFYNDPEFAALSSRDARMVMQTILKRCRVNGWAIPKELTDHDGWPTLSVKWHWYCFSKYDPSAAGSLLRKWAGKAKAEVEKEKEAALQMTDVIETEKNAMFDKQQLIEDTLAVVNQLFTSLYDSVEDLKFIRHTDIETLYDSAHVNNGLFSFTHCCHLPLKSLPLLQIMKH